MTIIQGPVARQVLIIVSKRDETILVVKLTFMDTAHGPLAGAFQPAPDAPAARKFERGDYIASLDEHYVALGGFVRLKRPVARH